MSFELRVRSAPDAGPPLLPTVSRALPSGARPDSGSYRVTARLKRGGMGELYLADRVDASGQRSQVVLKRLLASLVDDERYVAMFRAEAEVMARLDHPNIVKVVDIAWLGDTECLALEYVDGRNLQQVLGRCRKLGVAIPAPIALEIVRQVLDGLDYAHHFCLPGGRSMELVHRDVTPGNVLCGFDGCVKITDFGISKSKMSIIATTVGVVKGTTRYLAPEQIRGHCASPASDVFTTAVVLSEMLTGTPLFERGAVPATLFAIATGQRPPASDLVPMPAPLLAQAIERALSQSPDQRYPSARAFSQALSAAGLELGAPCDSSALAVFLRELFLAAPDSHPFFGGEGEVGGLDALDLTYLLEVRDPLEGLPVGARAGGVEVEELGKAKRALSQMVAGSDPLDATEFAARSDPDVFAEPLLEEGQEADSRAPGSEGGLPSPLGAPLGIPRGVPGATRFGDGVAQVARRALRTRRVAGLALALAVFGLGLLCGAALMGLLAVGRGRVPGVHEGVGVHGPSGMLGAEGAHPGSIRSEVGTGRAADGVRSQAGVRVLSRSDAMGAPASPLESASTPTPGSALPVAPTTSEDDREHSSTLSALEERSAHPAEDAHPAEAAGEGDFDEAAAETEATRPGFVEVVGPRGARVWIGGRAQPGRAPLVSAPLAPGTHRIRVQRGAFRRVARVRIEAGETVLLGKSRKIQRLTRPALEGNEPRRGEPVVRTKPR